ncbi:MAG: MFS transporter [Telmatospirillum sp.]|nr:MFS transporter [Telmatospirillum sp.]
MRAMEGTFHPKAHRILAASTLAFAACFAVWTLFSIIGIAIQRQLNLGETEFGLLIGTPILTGSISRLMLGLLADRFGGRLIFAIVMAASSGAALLLSVTDSYPMMLLAALGLGIAGGSFAVGIAYVSRWYPGDRQGTALGIFGSGNVGAAITTFIAPFLMVAFGWPTVARCWAAALAVVAVVFWLVTEDDPVHRQRRRQGVVTLTLRRQLSPLREIRVWRFSLYYFFVFGGLVALALWLPRFYVGAFGLDVKTAGILGALYILPASLFRAYGGVLSDRIGARRVMYWCFTACLLGTFILSYPATDYIVHGIHGDIRFSFGLGVVPFALLTMALGFAMALGTAAIFRHIPAYYPDHVGPVGGVVGMIGGLGGFFLPVAFGLMNDLTGLWTSCFMLLFLIVAVNLGWMHFAILRMERTAKGIPDRRFLAELQPGGVVLAQWDPEDAAFWQTSGRRVAMRNLWISIPALLLAFAVWMVWSVVVVNLPAAGFAFSPDQLFWLAALPGLTGALLRGFYAFMVPIFGGRTWTTFSTASLAVPALGIGMAVQHPATPYSVFLVLALLCGLGGGNFASSMAHISFFFPAARKGQALALNAGLGNLGVSVVQLCAPLVITVGMFGALGGAPQTVEVAGTVRHVWLQNAGFLWVPLILAATVAAWFGMNDIASAKSSLADQMGVFRRRHTWILCWLYAGTFGSFIGYSAAFPLLTRTLFPDVDPMTFAFLGPLVGAASRSLSGWMADRWGGARVTVWVFVAMTAGVGALLAAIGQSSFPGFLACFLVLFAVSGIGNASTFQMMPAIFRALHARRVAGQGDDALARAQQDAAREGAAVLGVTSAVAAIGAFFIPKSFGTSIALTGGATWALGGFVLFYLTCVATTWWFYLRPGAEARLPRPNQLPDRIAA